MSLELAIQQNTAAINALIEILSKGAIPAAAPEEVLSATEPEPQPAKADPKKRTKKETAPAGEPAATAENPATPEAGAAPSEPDTKPVTYSEAAKFVTEVANKKGRDAAIAVLASFGAKTLGEVKASRYADVITACKARL